MARDPISTSVFVAILDEKVTAMFVSNEARALVAEAAARCAAIARDDAPVRYGDYRDSIVAEGSKIGSGMAESQFGSNDPTWHIAEFGNATTPTYRTLTGAVEKAGLKFEPGR